MHLLCVVVTKEPPLGSACKPCNSKKKTKSLSDFWETLQ